MPSLTPLRPLAPFISFGRLSSILRRFCRVGGVCAVLLWSAGCAYKIEIKQGKEATLENVEQVRTGMSKDEVRALMGESLIDSLFRDNVWVYSYSLREKGFFNQQAITTVKIYFDQAGQVRDIRVDKLGEHPDEQPPGDDAAAE